MDSVFGIGLPELLVILLLAGIVMGPQRIRQVARWLGMMTAKLQAISRTFMRQLNAELDSLDSDGDLRGAMEEVQNLRQQVEDLRRELKTSTMRPMEEGKAALSEGKQALEESQQAIQQTIAPPGLMRPAENDNQNTPAGSNATENTQAAPSAPLPNLVDVPDDAE